MSRRRRRRENYSEIPIGIIFSCSISLLLTFNDLLSRRANTKKKKDFAMCSSLIFSFSLIPSWNWDMSNEAFSRMHWSNDGNGTGKRDTYKTKTNAHTSFSQVQQPLMCVSLSSYVCMPKSCNVRMFLNVIACGSCRIFIYFFFDVILRTWVLREHIKIIIICYTCT